jgi:hypothetical protein
MDKIVSTLEHSEFLSGCNCMPKPAGGISDLMLDRIEKPVKNRRDAGVPWKALKNVVWLIETRGSLMTRI